MMLRLDALGKPHINLEALQRSDWRIIATAGARALPVYGHAVAVKPSSQGLCNAFLSYRAPKNNTVLFVDVEWHDDDAMRKFAAEYMQRSRQFKEWIGFVAFVVGQGYRPPQVKCYMQLMV